MNKTVVAAVTPAGRAAISTIAIRGKDAQSLVQQYFRRANGSLAPDLPIDRILFGRWSVRPNDGSEVVGEEVVVCRRPDDRGLEHVELHCHGGSAARQAILDDLDDAGGHVVPWTDWVLGAAPSLTVAEAQLALAQTTTLRTAHILLQQQQGALQRAIAEIAHELPRQPDHALSALESLLETARYGLRLTVPWSVAMVGPPNVGKSCLTNALLGYQRAIVHDLPGTTRDILTATTAIDGWPVEFSDTAGMRRTDDPIEAAGVGLAADTAHRADCIVLVFDAAQPWNESYREFYERFAGDGKIVVQNKLDLVSSPPADRPSDVATSALCGDGLEALLRRISQTLVPHPPTPGQAVIFTTRQRERVQRALLSLRLGQSQNALQQLSMMESLAEE